MTEPDHDTSLLDGAHYTPPLALYPLRRMTAETEPGQWTRYTPASNGDPERWTTTRALAIHLPGVGLVNCTGWRWATAHGLIRVAVGFAWDGASGPAIDDPSAVLASLVHDIACTRIEGPDGATHPLPGYWARHALYARILGAQGEPFARCAWSWFGLVAANWYVDSRKGRP